MNVDPQLLFFFSALGAFNSSLLSIYFFFFAKPRHRTNYFLAALMAVLSIRIWKSIFFYFNPELSKIYLQIGLSACFLIGPFLYAFIQSKLSDSPNKNRLINIQLILMSVLIIVIGIVYPYQKFPEIWSIMYTIINLQWLFYIIVSAILLKDVFIKLFKRKESLSYQEVWMLSVFLGIFLIWLAYFFSSYTSYIMGALSFSFVLYLSILLIYFKRKKGLIISEKKEKYAGNKIENEQAQLLHSQIDNFIIEEEIYKNPDLTLPQLAQQLNLRPHLISQLLNDNLNKSFSQFINEYRIKEATKLLENKSQFKMEIIAEMCGFNSNSTFYTAFKKVTGTTPAKYSKN